MALAALIVIDIIRVWSASAGQPPNDNSAFVYVATAVGAFVGGFVAVGFGIKPQQTQVAESRARRNVRSLGFLHMFGPKELIGSAYVIVYLVKGVVAVATWIAHLNEITGLVKNLALTFVGLPFPSPALI